MKMSLMVLSKEKKKPKKFMKRPLPEVKVRVMLKSSKGSFHYNLKYFSK